MSQSKCPDVEELLLFNDGLISSDRRIDEITAHLSQCASCLAHLEKLQPGNLAVLFRDAYQDDQDTEALLARSREHSQKILDSVSLPRKRHQPFDQDLYEIIEQLEFDDLFRTYLASDVLLQQNVIVKIVRRNRLLSIDEEAQFSHDISRLTQLKHPNILPLIRYGQWNQNRNYLVFPAVNHLALDQWLSPGQRMELSTFLAIVGQICDALEYAHEQGVFHRHLRPERVYLDAQINVVVSEFGLIYDGRYQGDLIEPFNIQPRFASPEVIQNNPAKVDHRADIYSLGKMMEWMLDATELDRERRLSLQAVAQQCTRRSRRGRFQSVSEFRKSILDAMDGPSSLDETSPNDSPE